MTPSKLLKELEQVRAALEAEAPADAKNAPASKGADETDARGVRSHSNYSYSNARGGTCRPSPDALPP